MTPDPSSMRLPFLRRALSQDEYVCLVNEALAIVQPVTELLRTQGIAGGLEAEAGRAHHVEFQAVEAQVALVRPLERRLAGARPSRCLGPEHRSLRRLIASYRKLLLEYANACRAIGEANAERYREHNRRGGALDGGACEELRGLLAALDSSGLVVEVPAMLRRIAERAEAYRRVQGGAFAFWE